MYTLRNSLKNRVLANINKATDSTQCLHSTRNYQNTYKLLNDLIEFKLIMELTDKYYDAADYIETASGNKVCRKSVLCGSQNIMLHGKVCDYYMSC